MTAAEAVLGLVLAPFLMTGAAVLHGPSGYLALLVPRRTRASYRHNLAHRRWRPVPRGRQKSARVSDLMRARVMYADRRRCVWCRQGRREVWARNDKLQVDHMIPWSWGGLTCIWNSAVLCGRCNKVKGTVFEDDGQVRGRVYGRSGSRRAGLAIYRREQVNRLRPSRCVRALIAIATVR